MIIKLFKTILVLSLCIGVSLPTNAAVSVSDGSAFVTKAEFSADLNNLSNRMAQLENSLDAKIDSLVSSYLTRNGIWNGEKQTIINTYFIDMTGTNQGGATLTYSNTFPSNFAAGHTKTFINSKKTLCESLGKTGLCHINISVIDRGQQVASDGRSYSYWQVPQPSSSTSWNLFHVDNNYLSFVIGSTEKGRIKPLVWSYETIDATRLVVLKGSVGVSNLYFFASKGDKVEYIYNVGLTAMSDGCGVGLRSKSIAAGITPTGIRVDIVSFTVY